jgi:glutathione synthase
MELLFVVDPLDRLDAAHDTSVAIMEVAQARGHRVLTTTMRELGACDGRATALCRPLTLRPASLVDGRWRASLDWARVGPAQRVVLDSVDAVFIRTDPPVDAAYLRGTYVLDLVDPHRTVMVNSPAGLRNANEKLFALRFPELCPPTLVSADAAEIVATTRGWGKAVLKPTEGMAGRGIMILDPADPNLHSIIETATVRGRDQVVVQRFLPEAADGDRRVIVVDGRPVGAVRRVASAGEFRCNMAVGARPVADEVTPRDEEICARMAPLLAAHGLLLVGLDVIGGYLTEVNVTSPTGVREIDAFAGSRLATHLLTAVESRLPHPTPRVPS